MKNDFGENSIDLGRIFFSYYIIILAKNNLNITLRALKSNVFIYNMR